MQRNEELFYKVAEAIRSHPELYDQGVYKSEDSCGTTCCIAGWAVQVAEPQEFLTLPSHWIHERAGKLLGLSWPESSTLFAGDWIPKGADDYMDIADPALLADLTAKALYALGQGASIEEVSG